MPDKTVYIHGTDPSEQHRLVQLNRLTNGPFLDFLDVEPGSRIIEVGSGLGILATAVAAVRPNLRVVGVELADAQLQHAARRENVSYVRGDAHRLPLADDGFDLAYTRYLLEHVADPGVVLAEMRRVLRPGGRIVVMENDVTLARFDPPCRVFESVWSSFAALQGALGGDALIGRRLFRLLHDAGFSRIDLSVQPEVHWYGSPGWSAWVSNIVGNIESARRALIDRGFCTATMVDAAVDELRWLLGRPDASSLWIWSRARGIR
jgi:SAM-dependent methyltransferase